ncbi:ankyrin repeat domain-containing protein 7 [Rhynchocyon petersi]
MKKLFSLWRGKDESRSCSSDPQIGLAQANGARASVQLGYSLRDRDLRQLHKAVSVGDLEKVQEYLHLRRLDVNVCDKERRTPLHLACANGYPNIVAFLINNQCKINAQDRENRSPLIKAVQCQRESCAALLLKHGADPHLVDADCNTALHYAACGKSISLVENLLEHRANLEAQNKDGYTPLLLAVTENNADMVEFLLKKGADVNASDNSKRTALMIALSDEPTSLVSLILQHDVDLSCKDIYGFTAEDYASFNGFTIYHQLMANYGKGKEANQTSFSKNTTLDTVYALGYPKEGKEMKSEIPGDILTKGYLLIGSLINYSALGPYDQQIKT